MCVCIIMTSNICKRNVTNMFHANILCESISFNKNYGEISPH